MKRNLTTRSKSSLFLLEMLFATFILIFASTVCIQIFAAARIQRQKARELNHIQELTTSACERLEGWNEEFSDDASQGIFQYFYDPDWNLCQQESASYIMTMQLSLSAYAKYADLRFENISGDLLYEVSCAFPRSEDLSFEKE